MDRLQSIFNYRQHRGQKIIFTTNSTTPSNYHKKARGERAWNLFFAAVMEARVQ